MKFWRKEIIGVNDKNDFAIFGLSFESQPEFGAFSMTECYMLHSISYLQRSK